MITFSITSIWKFATARFIHELHYFLLLIESFSQPKEWNTKTMKQLNLTTQTARKPVQCISELQYFALNRIFLSVFRTNEM